MKKHIYLVLIAQVFLASCNKFVEVNRDPARPDASLATPAILFPPAVMNSAGRIGGELTIIGGIWAQYYTQSPASNQYKTIDAYNLQNTDYEDSYTLLFVSALEEYQKIISLSLEQKKWSFYLMSALMKAYTYQVLADLYDRVPYTEALGGVDNLTPKFDDGYTIYVGLLKEIDNALAKDQSEYISSDSEKKADLVFGGNLVRWKQFANTLKLKMYLRMVNAKPAEAESGIRGLYSTGAEFLNESAGISTFTDVVDKQNPFYAYNIVKLNTATNLRASKTFVSWLTSNGDPRVLKFYGIANPVAMNQGDNLGDKYTPTPTVFVQSAVDPVHFFSKAESLLMQAEARVRYFGGDGAKALYDNGVTASFADCGQSVGELLTGAYAFPADQAAQIESIIVQKWASMAYGCHGLEAFFEKNRTGFPRTSPVYSTAANYVPGQLVYSITGVTAGAFPKRLLFPNAERSRNINTPNQVPLTVKVWWGL